MGQSQELQLLVELVRAGSLSAAAREMGVTTAAISKRLAQIEDRLGVRLLNRNTRRLSPTAEGELYLENARRILHDIEHLDQLIASRQTHPRGRLKVNAPLGFGRTYIAPAIVMFARHYPEVEVQLLLTDSPGDFVQDAFDVAIRFGDIPDTRLIARRIAPNRRLVCASPDYLKKHGRPMTPQDLAKHQCIVLRQNDDPYGLWRFTRGSETETVKVRGALSSNDGEVTLTWALAGLGILQRAEWDLARHLRAGRLELLLQDYALPPADIHAVFPERLHLSAKVRVFIDFLVDYFRSRRQRGEGASW
ncbi:LysR family transcriptional regulator [Bordetella sp. 02P26C-1]|uniref:LysR family transcriptional regulator n=1 Tax=Bordetella sp. 02P26C-1 TaxID=2683195 RepID=UPI001352E287|nr:LysR family transcriptional regulator [Bordetella sp. 02P26C-1]MVW78622.1 LysR family transcriptional regulator [Bordetella sp. 02P26C-1]